MPSFESQLYLIDARPEVMMDLLVPPLLRLWLLV
jgi:hypothetical protein